MERKKIHFQSKEAYDKWLAFKHIHGIELGRNEIVYIHGKKHKVHHNS